MGWFWVQWNGSLITQALRTLYFIRNKLIYIPQESFPQKNWRLITMIFVIPADKAHILVLCCAMHVYVHKLRWWWTVAVEGICWGHCDLKLTEKAINIHQMSGQSRYQLSSNIQRCLCIMEHVEAKYKPFRKYFFLKLAITHGRMQKNVLKLIKWYNYLIF